MTESIDLFHAIQHMKYTRGKLEAWAKKNPDHRELVAYDIREVGACIERTKLLLAAIKDGEV